MLHALLASSHAHAAQHLVRPGESWSELAPRIAPGDEIILMPGRHLSATFDELHGTREGPITIRGLSPSHPSIIEARQHGLRLRKPQHVIIRDLAITGATVSGISITYGSLPGDAQRQPEAGERRSGDEPVWAAHVIIRNVTIEKTGPHGRRNAIRLDGIRHVHIDRVRIEGWGGAAVKIIASADVRIEHSVMQGREDHGQLSGVHIRGGSENIRVSRCFFHGAGEAAIVFGEAMAAARKAANGEPEHEARHVTIERNVFRQGESAFAFLSADQCRVRNNVIVDPARFVYLIAPPGDLRRTTFGSNLIVWKPGTLEALSHLQPPARGEGLAIEQNLWWSGEPPEALAKLGKPAGDLKSPQVMDVAPNLDAQFKPRTRRAQLFGTEGP